MNQHTFKRLFPDYNPITKLSHLPTDGEYHGDDDNRSMESHKWVWYFAPGEEHAVMLHKDRFGVVVATPSAVTRRDLDPVISRTDAAAILGLADATGIDRAVVVVNVDEVCDEAVQRLGWDGAGHDGQLGALIRKAVADALLDTAVLGVKERKLSREQMLALGLTKAGRADQYRKQHGT